MSPEVGKVVHVNSATLVVGPTGSGKSALLATLAKYVWSRYHKITRLYTTDGGGFPMQIQALMQLGIMQVWRCRTRDLPDGSLSFETCMRASLGWWPKRLNPTTGETEPGIELVPPITEQYNMHCPNGHLVKSVPFQALLTPMLCPHCQTLTSKANMQVTKTSHTTKGFENVGAVCYDGISSMLSWMMADMGQRAGRLELKGEEGAIGGKIISGDMKFGGSSRSHYGFAQSRAEELALNSLSIPGLVVPPTFTALLMETDDEGDLRIAGPKLIGRAKTEEAPQWFGNCVESAVVKDEKDRRVFRLYLAEFIDSHGVRHLVKNRADPGALPAYLEDPPLVSGTEKATAFQQFNLGVFFTLLETALASSVKDGTAEFPDAPGLPAGVVEVGEAGAATPVAQGATAATSPASAPAAVGAAPAAPAAPRAGAPRPAARPAPAQTTKAPATAAPAPAPAAPAPAVATPAPAAAAQPAAAPAQPQPGVQGEQLAPGKQATAWAPPGAPRPPAPAPRVSSKK